MKKRSHHPAQRVIASSLLISMLGFTTFGTQALAQQAPAYPPPAAAAAPEAYAPPTADQLYQMVAPIALFPDKLVALVLASSTYPDQVTAANDMLTQNPNLTGQALVNATDQQSWDPSVKALTQFPSVLSQMTSNMAWTTALGQAYYNDPNDVLNSVQVMRQRARAAGHLTSNNQMVVTTAAPAAAPDYTPDPDAPVYYDGPAIVPAPPQTIVIAPAQPDVVYVPSYNPAVVYGAPIAYYPGYVYAPFIFPAGVAITAGIFSFGIGIAVGTAIFAHVGWGWHAWGMQWQGPPRGRGPGGWHPAVVYNHTTYVSRTTSTVINHNRVVNNYRGGPAHNPAMRGPQQTRQQQMRAPQPAARPGGPMSIPHFNTNDARPGARPAPGAMPNRTMKMNHAAVPAAHGAPAPANRSFNAAPHAPAMQAHPAAPRPQMQRQNFQQPHVNAPRPAQARPAPHPQAAPRPQAPRPQPHPEAARPHPAPTAHPAPAPRRDDHDRKQ